MKILIVDDNTVSRKIMKAMCMKLGYRVVEAKNGAEAWKLFQKHPVRIVISDWMMPVLSGLELCKKIRAGSKSDTTFFFLVTGLKTSVTDFSRAYKAGANDFIYKPLDFHVIRNQVERAEHLMDLLNDDAEQYYALRQRISDQDRALAS